ncbi:MAG: hypothetical protein NVS2B15_18470 [Pseudarthrobacter sp.]
MAFLRETLAAMTQKTSEAGFPLWKQLARHVEYSAGHAFSIDFGGGKDTVKDTQKWSLQYVAART